MRLGGPSRRRKIDGSKIFADYVIMEIEKASFSAGMQSFSRVISLADSCARKIAYGLVLSLLELSSRWRGPSDDEKLLSSARFARPMFLPPIALLSLTKLSFFYF
jgi:hypothetical protein